MKPGLLSGGERVLIVGAKHPWRGHAGKVLRAFHPSLLDGRMLEVELDGSGQRCGARDGDVEVIAGKVSP